MLKNRLIELVAVLLFLLLLSLVLILTDVDRRVAAAVLASSDLDHIGLKFWPAGAEFPWNMIYKWAAVPGFILAGVALIVLAAGFFRQKLATCRNKALFVILFLALGPGLVVNVLLKDQLGRARPREVIEFGGKHEFTRCWQPGTAGRNSSFPSGHASIAFFLMAPWFVLRDKRRTTATVFLVFGLSFGTLVGITRILQGGHFVTDVLWSAGLLYLTGGILAFCMGFGRETQMKYRKWMMKPNKR